MRITYDAAVDAAYIYLSDDVYLPDTRHMDEDINLDFDSHDQLVGIEVLDASKRLNLPFLMAYIDGMEDRWTKLRQELVRRKADDVPVLTVKQQRKNWVEAVGNDYAELKRHDTKNAVRVTRSEFESAAPKDLQKHKKWAITRALRDIALKL